MSVLVYILMSNYTRKDIREGRTPTKINRGKIFSSIAVLGIITILVTPFCIEQVKKKSDTTTINFYIPQDFYLIYMDYDNITIISKYNYSVYIISTSGHEYDNETIWHNQIYIDQYLLAWFLDIEQYNMSIYDDSMSFNNKSIKFSFKHNQNNTFFGTDAFDLSLYNGTNNLRSMDFGNSIFIDFPLGEVSNVYMNNITCHRLNNNEFRPYLYFTYNNTVYHERMAWNNTMVI
jgi:hypothetical protein